MRGRKPSKFILKRKDKNELKRLLRAGDTPLRVARRAQILLSRAAGRGVEPVAEKVERDPVTVWRVCERYHSAGLEAALYDGPRSGRPRVFSPPY